MAKIIAGRESPLCVNMSTARATFPKRGAELKKARANFAKIHDAHNISRGTHCHRNYPHSAPADSG